MERFHAVLLVLLGVRFSSTSGRVVEMRVRPGDDVTLHSDCVLKAGFKLKWLRKSLHDHQPPLVISADSSGRDFSSQYSVVWNQSNNTYDLLVKNVSESDLGLYYCALHQTKVCKNRSGDRVYDDIHQDGNRTTFLSFLDVTVPCTSQPQPTPCPPVSDSSICWKLLVSVCPVCVLLSSLISFTCVYCICRTRTKADCRAEQRENMKMRKSNEARGENVCYATLDLPNSGPKCLKKKKKNFESSDFSTYSEVKTERV